MRSLDIEDDVEGFVGEWQLLGIALLEAQARGLMTRSAMADSLGIQVEADVFHRLIDPGEIGSATPMSATDLEHAEHAQVDDSPNVLIELDVRTVRLVGRRQAKPRGLGILEGVVEEVDALRPDATGEERIPPGPKPLTELGADEDLLDESHQDQTPCSTKALVAAADQPRLATGFAGLGCGTLAYLTNSPSKASRARVSA